MISDVVGEGTPQVTTSLQPKVADAPRKGRHRTVGDEEIVTLEPARNNGIPRSSWYRSVRRVSGLSICRIEVSNSFTRLATQGR